MKTSQTRSRPLPSNEELLSQIRLLLDSPEDDLQAAIMKELLAGTLRLHDSHLDVLDLKIVNRAVKELRHAFHVFHDYRDRRKISIFGSVRTASDDPNYQMAFQFSRQIVEEGFMVITGGADGIMRACQEGAGRENSPRGPRAAGVTGPSLPPQPELAYFLRRGLDDLGEKASQLVPGIMPFWDEMRERRADIEGAPDYYAAVKRHAQASRDATAEFGPHRLG